MASHDVSDPALVPLTEEQIAASTDNGSFSRGKTYFRKGHILSPSVEGNVLRASCIGSSEDYTVSAALARPDQPDAHNPTEWHCSCPRGDFCKHIVALLLTWVHDRVAFQVRRPLASTLQDLDHDTLVSIVEGLVAHSPQMRSVVELLVPGSGVTAPSIPAMTAKQAKSQVRRAYAQVIKSHYGREWGEPVTLPNDLGRLVSMSEQMGSIGAWRQALPVAIALLEELGDAFNEFNDEEGFLQDTVARVEQVLVDALANKGAIPTADVLTEDERERIVTALVDLWYLDVFEIGGIGLSQHGPEGIATFGTASERAAVLTQLQGLEKRATPGDWKTDRLIHFKVLLLEANEPPPEDLLRLYQDNGLWSAAASLLVSLDRPTEAVALVRKHIRNPQDLLPVATSLAAYSTAWRDKAIQLVEDIAWETEGRHPGYDWMLSDWLMEQLVEAGAADRALPLMVKRFRTRPTMDHWDVLRSIARSASTDEESWRHVRDAELAHLRRAGAWLMVASVLFQEGDVSGALDAYGRLSQGGTTGGWYSEGDFGVQLARAAHRDHPDWAARFYQQRARTMIGRRKRDAYQAAARYLASLRALLLDHQREEEWDTIIADIRAEYKSLRALREELDAIRL